MPHSQVFQPKLQSHGPLWDMEVIATTFSTRLIERLAHALSLFSSQLAYGEFEEGALHMDPPRSSGFPSAVM